MVVFTCSSRRLVFLVFLVWCTFIWSSRPLERVHALKHPLQRHVSENRVFVIYVCFGQWLCEMLSTGHLLHCLGCTGLLRSLMLCQGLLWAGPSSLWRTNNSSLQLGEWRKVSRQNQWRHYCGVTFLGYCGKILSRMNLKWRQGQGCLIHGWESGGVGFTGHILVRVCWITSSFPTELVVCFSVYVGAVEFTSVMFRCLLPLSVSSFITFSFIHSCGAHRMRQRISLWGCGSGLHPVISSGCSVEMRDLWARINTPPPRVVRSFLYTL